MNLYIVEDDMFHLEDISITLETLGHTCIGNSDDPFEAQEQIGKLMPDAVVLDIHLNGKQSGIKLGKRIKSLYKIPVLFTTFDCNVEVMSEAAEISPIAYITKPINEKDLQAALILAEKSSTNNKKDREEPSVVFIKSGNKLIKVALDTILFAHTDSKNYCSIITSDNKKLSVRYSILSLLKLLDNKTFVQTHRSYIINWEKIDSFYEPDQIIDINSHHIPIGRTFKEELYKRLKVI
ncbi:LytTR family two component transcriptional regulator [Aquimarina sp. MAR_2010_214]|uniref:LytR/AlgR family response regulator transcription factor n=1 Tax=Aquimarina sp. MAR_2010_214 TaxID=1250026 RepID=UPI000C7059B0|nr:response regulator transcription factor [Aquimarina sp. MAR_2010_214]PKV52167.1 LytTR family two component transcriptional regulator [Aquimarina sp. MAR_2010_214]